MKNFLTRLYKIFWFIALGFMIISSVYFLIKVWSLPNEVGVHFGPNGEFDVIASKWFGLYPFIIGNGTLAVMKFFSFLASKIKSGLKVTDTGEENLKISVNLTMSLISLIVCVFFSYWSWCVLNQVTLNTIFGGAFAIAIMILFPIFIISVIIIRIANKKSSD